MSKPHFQPAGYHTATPYLIIRGAARAIEFYTQAFGAREVFRLPGPDGKIGHAEIKIGDSVLMLADEGEGMGTSSPEALGGTPMSLMLYLEDADAITAQAVAAGATVLRALQDQFYGDRSATLRDPFGHQWTIATHIEDVPPEELDRRMKAFSEQK